MNFVTLPAYIFTVPDELFAPNPKSWLTPLPLFVCPINGILVSVAAILSPNSMNEFELAVASPIVSLSSTVKSPVMVVVPKLDVPVLVIAPELIVPATVKSPAPALVPPELSALIFTLP